MKTTRYYQSNFLKYGDIRVIRAIFTDRMKWPVGTAVYRFFYPGSSYEVERFDELEPVVNEHGQPSDIHVMLRTEGGRMIKVDTRALDQSDVRRITIEVDSKEDPIKKVFDAIETELSLKPIDQVPTNVAPRSAFIAQSFDDAGDNYANELARFLTLLGIKSQGGRGSAPRNVSDKVLGRLDR